MKPREAKKLKNRHVHMFFLDLLAKIDSQFKFGLGDDIPLRPDGTQACTTRPRPQLGHLRQGLSSFLMHIPARFAPAKSTFLNTCSVCALPKHFSDTKSTFYRRCLPIWPPLPTTLRLRFGCTVRCKINILLILPFSFGHPCRPLCGGALEVQSSLKSTFYSVCLSI